MNALQTLIARLFRIPALTRAAVAVLDLRAGQTLVIKVENYSQKRGEAIARQFMDRGWIPEGVAVVVTSKISEFEVLSGHRPDATAK